jgi:hypothetical protein
VSSELGEEAALAAHERNRPGVEEALRLLERGEASALVAAKRVRLDRAAGRSLAAIANGLNADRIPTAQGGRRWYPGTVRYTLNRTG